MTLFVPSLGGRGPLLSPSFLDNVVGLYVWVL